MPKKTAIIADSTNDIPVELREKYNIYVVPLTIVWGDEQFKDGIDLKAEEFYKRLAVDKVIPTTSQPTPKEFLETFKQAQNDGAEEIVVYMISSAMSGTIESARSAAEGFPLPIHIVDSKSNSMSLGWQILAAARAREAGGNSEDMIAASEKVRQNLHFHIILDTIDFLFKGGRIAHAAKFVGGVLHIKPQIRVNHETGSVEPGDIARTRKQAIERLYASFVKKVDVTHPLHIAVLHNAALKEAEELAAKVREELHPVEIVLSIVSPVLGVHTGPQALALCGYSE